MLCGLILSCGCSISRRRRWAACLVSTFALTVTQYAAAQTWDGGSPFNNNWSTAANWNPNVVPDNTGTANINMSGTTRLTPNVDVPWRIFSLSFDVLAGPFVIGGSALTIRGGGMFTSDADIQT